MSTLSPTDNTPTCLPHLPAGKHECTGCGLCESVCAQGAISMQLNAAGFVRPVVDAQRCIGCHACEKMCARLDAPPQPEDAAVSYHEGWAHHAETRRGSSSGGIVPLLARWMIKRGGCVFGVAMEGTQQPKFICVSREEDLPLLQGSKYLQADTSGCLAQVAEKLKAGVPVLFIGVACQVNALRVRFGCQRDLLYAVDIACYGAPGRKLFDAWLRELPDRGRHVTRIEFRNKHHGWRDYAFALHDASGHTEIQPRRTHPYMRAYLSGLALNDACYHCHHATDARPGDLSLGDFWGRAHDAETDRLGVSSIICRTDKGREMLQAIEAEMHLAPISQADVTKGNDGFANPPRTAPPARPIVLQELEHLTASQLCKRWLVKRGVLPRPFFRIGKRIFILPSFIYKKFRRLFLRSL